MKNKLLIIITILFFPLFSLATHQMKSAATLFNTLINCSSEKEMTEICQEKGLKYEGCQDGFQNYSYSDGTTIQFKMDSIASDLTVPLIKTTVRDNKKNVEAMINSLRYIKNKDKYIRGHKYGRTQETVILETHPKDKTITIICTKVKTNT